MFRLTLFADVLVNFLEKKGLKRKWSGGILQLLGQCITKEVEGVKLDSKINAAQGVSVVGSSAS